MKKSLEFISCDYDGETFTREEIDLLWSHGVNMDDWDYAIITDPDVIQSREVEYEDTEWEWFPYVPEEERVWPREQISDTAWRYLGPPYDKGDYVKKKKISIEWECLDWTLDRLLTGCCSNTWYLIEWKGEKRAIGIAYHA
jgi:hypothetical protein